MILTGDVNLRKDVATALVQPEEGEPDLLEHWHIESSNAAKSGDVAFVKGTASKPFDITIGASYSDRGMRHDSRDFFGMTLKVPLVKVPPPAMPRPGAFAAFCRRAEHGSSASSGAPQPAESTADAERSARSSSRGVSRSSCVSPDARRRWLGCSRRKPLRTRCSVSSRS